MPIRVQCSCGRAFPVAESRAGQREFCPMCGVQCLVPAAEGGGAGKILLAIGGVAVLGGAAFGAYWFLGRAPEDAASTNGQGGSKVTFGDAPDVPRPGAGGPASPTPRAPGPRDPTPPPTGVPPEVAARANELITQLGSDDDYVRAHAARKLMEMDCEVEPLLREAAGRGVQPARRILRAWKWKRELPAGVWSRFDKEIASLTADSDATRKKIVETWIRRGESECAPLLAELVEDDSAEVRIAALEAAILFRAPVRGEGIALVLEDADTRHQGLAVLAAGLLEVPGAAPRIRPMLADSAKRDLAVATLGILRDAASAEEIAKDLAAQDPRVRARAFEALGRIGRFPGGFPIDAIRDPDPRVRAAVFVAAGRCGEATLQNQIAQLLAESDPRMRSVGAEALGALGQDTGIPILMALLTDTDAGVRYEAARALGRMRHRAAVPVIVEMLDDRSVAEATSDDAVVRSLLDTSIVQGLRLAIDVPKGREVREGALLALEDATGQCFEGAVLDERVSAARAWWAHAQPEYPR